MKLKEYLVAIIGIIAFLAIGIIILIFFGVSQVFYVMLLGIIIGIFLAIYYIWKTTKAKKTLTWLKDSKEKIANEIKDMYLSMEKNLSKVSELNIDVNSELNELKYVRMNLASLGCYTQNYDIIRMTLEKLNLSYLAQKKKDIQESIKKIEISVIDKLRYKISEIYHNLKGIITEAKEVGFNVKELNYDITINTLNEGIEKTKEIEKKEKEIFESLYNEISNLENIASNIEDTFEIRLQLEMLKNKKNFEAMKNFISIRKTINGILMKKVDEVKAAVYEGQRRLSSITLTENEKVEFENIIEDVENLNVRNIGNVSDIEKRYRKFLDDLLQKIRADFKVKKEYKYAIEIPEWLKNKYYEGKKIENFDIYTNKSLSINDFVKEVIEKLILYEKEYKNMNITNRIMNSYKVVFSVIEDIIAHKGYITPDDLSVNYKEDFLRLYVTKHPEKINKIKVKLEDLLTKEEKVEMKKEEIKENNPKESQVVTEEVSNKEQSLLGMNEKSTYHQEIHGDSNNEKKYSLIKQEGIYSKEWEFYTPPEGNNNLKKEEKQKKDKPKESPIVTDNISDKESSLLGIGKKATEKEKKIQNDFNEEEIYSLMEQKGIYSKEWRFYSPSEGNNNLKKGGKQNKKGNDKTN